MEDGGSSQYVYLSVCHHGLILSVGSALQTHGSFSLAFVLPPHGDLDVRHHTWHVLLQRRP